MINFLHTFNPQPILFQIGFLKIHWYGLFMVLAILVGLFFVSRLAKKSLVSQDEVFDLGFYAIIFSLIGARIYAVFLEIDFYLKNPFQIIAVWNGGLAIHGAIIGGAAAVFLYCYFKKKSFWLYVDLAAPALALGQSIGRWGNYFNQEIFGKPTNLPWGIPIALQNRPAAYLNFQHFHPTFLYESALNLINFFLLLALFFLLNKRNEELRIKNQELRIKNQGFVFLVYLINYSLIRIVMESLRLDETPLVFGIRLPVLVSLGVIIICGALLAYRWRGNKLNAPSSTK